MWGRARVIARLSCPGLLNRILRVSEKFQDIQSVKPDKKVGATQALKPIVERNEEDDEDYENTETHSNDNPDPVRPAVNVNPYPVICEHCHRANERTSQPTQEDEPKNTLPKTNDIIVFKETPSSEFKEAVVIGRAGKASGQYKSWVNLKTKDKSFSADIEKLAEWHIKSSSTESEEVNVVIVPISEHGQARVKTAKERELKNWRDFNVFTRD